MKAIYDPRQRAHNPSQFMAYGVMKPNPEQPERTEILRSGAEAAGCAFTAPDDAGLGPIAALHSPEYLTFLQTIHARWSEIEGAGPEVISHIKPGDRRDSYPRSALGQAGYHQADTSCPINAATWGSAYWSAQTAITAADLVANGEHAAYALCRPPGHHAFGDMAGAFVSSTTPALRRSCCGIGASDRRFWMSTCIMAMARRGCFMIATMF